MLNFCVGFIQNHSGGSFMLKSRVLFYYTTTGIALGFLFSMLLFFNVKLEMMVGLGLVMYIFTGFGLMVGIAKTRLDWKYSFFYIELAAILIALLSGRLQQFFYITKETLDNHKSCIRDHTYFHCMCHHHQSSKPIYCTYDRKVPKGIYERRKKSDKRTTAKTK